jgi:hypothetical protein
MGLSDHGPKTLVIVDEIAADEQALKSLTDDVCATFGTYGLPCPAYPITTWATTFRVRC